jgi:hypothetical protein
MSEDMVEACLTTERNYVLPPDELHQWIDAHTYLWRADNRGAFDCMQYCIL